MIDSILNFIFPVACMVCRAQVLKRRYGAVYPTCWDTLVLIAPPICPKCGMPVTSIDGPYARRRTGENIFDFARSAVFFNDTARKIIHHLKPYSQIGLSRSETIKNLYSAFELSETFEVAKVGVDDRLTTVPR